MLAQAFMANSQMDRLHTGNCRNGPAFAQREAFYVICDRGLAELWMQALPASASLNL